MKTQQSEPFHTKNLITLYNTFHNTGFVFGTPETSLHSEKYHSPNISMEDLVLAMTVYMQCLKQQPGLKFCQ
jgi:hypothetical protein